MSVATEKITDVTDQVLDLVAKVQEPVVNGIRTVVDKVGDRVPEIKVRGLGDTLPGAQELVDVTFTFRQKRLEQSREFAQAVLDATKPVRKKFVSASAPKVKAAPKPKAA